jgi:3-oxocholest-4-en-26-oyl-CoA dehydrogenase beta subunit
MDFNLDEELVAVRDLAREILTDKAGVDRVRETERSETRVDEELWRELAKAGLVGIALPESAGGAGLGLPGLCVLLEEVGRAVAPVPLWSAAVAALVLATHGDDNQRELVPALAEGGVRVTLALEEYDGAEPAAPRAVARQDDQGWRLTGTKAVVPSPQGSDHVLVSASTPQGPGLFLVGSDAPGVSWELTETTTRDRAGNLALVDVVAQPVRSFDADVLGWTLDRAAVALAATQVGVAEGAMRLAASYLSEREQFGRPLATFQAVQHQLADCYIDIDAMRVTLWQAVSDLSEDAVAPGARRSPLVAKWWADQAGLDVVHRSQHLHGGIGVDVDYPVHRYFLWGKQLSSTLGGPAAALAELGARLATEEVAS